VPSSISVGKPITFDLVSVEYVPGDVVFVPSGPFQGSCGVVRGIDAHSSQVWLDLSMGWQRTHRVAVDFDEIELA
jgi:transcription antitermination factor NusG